EVAEDPDEFVLDVERGVAVVAEVLAAGDDDAVAGKHHLASHVPVVGERKRAYVGFRRKRFLADHHPRSAVLRSCRELERQTVVALSGQRPRANPLQDRKSTRLNSSHVAISYAVFCLK